MQNGEYFVLIANWKLKKYTRMGSQTPRMPVQLLNTKQIDTTEQFSPRRIQSFVKPKQFGVDIVMSKLIQAAA